MLSRPSTSSQHYCWSELPDLLLLKEEIYIFLLYLLYISFLEVLSFGKFARSLFMISYFLRIPNSCVILYNNHSCFIISDHSNIGSLLFYSISVTYVYLCLFLFITTYMLGYSWLCNAYWH